MLTKTSYLSFTQCAKRFWLDAFQPDLATPPDPSSQRRLQTGQEVDKRAWDQFPDGRLIPYRPQPEEMAALTAQAIAEGVETLFQATFVVNDLLIRADILQKTDLGWHLIEVKSSSKPSVESSTKDKPEKYVPDVAFQLCVLQQAGLIINQASLMRLNGDYRYPEFGNLFVLTDLTDKSFASLPQVEANITAMRQLVVESVAPDVVIGRHCSRPHNCPFYAHCWQDIGGLTIYSIPKLSEKRERPLQDAGVLYLTDVPADYPLTDTQRAFVNFSVKEEINIDHIAIKQALDGLIYPLYFLDFETIDYAVPTFDGCQPYQKVPFQYSCHILDAEGALTHHEYLHTDNDDPRRPLVESLLDHIGETGSLIAYNSPTENGVLQHLAVQFPEHSQHMMDMAKRLWDQLPIFRQHYRDYRFGGSNSLKAVLSVIVPELSYKLLDVQNGTQAQVVWEAMIGERDTAVKEQMVEQLRAYCHLDTLAMVEIHQALRAL